MKGFGPFYLVLAVASASVGATLPPNNRQFLEKHCFECHDSEITKEGRATQRRLNRYEYENTLRDLLHAPWLQIRDSLPEDGEAYRFNKVGDALDISHVQMARYLSAADYALRQAMAQYPEQPSG